MCRVHLTNKPRASFVNMRCLARKSKHGLLVCLSLSQNRVLEMGWIPTHSSALLVVMFALLVVKSALLVIMSALLVVMFDLYVIKLALLVVMLSFLVVMSALLAVAFASLVFTCA